jgi:uncharacterized protein
MICHENAVRQRNDPAARQSIAPGATGEAPPRANLTPSGESGISSARVSAPVIAMFNGGAAMARDFATEDSNKALVQASFDRWRSGTGGPFELLAADAEWTIVGSSPLSRTYHSKQEFLDAVIDPFNARMSTPLVPTVRGIYADGETVIILFDAAATVRDGKPYHNTYTWYFRMRNAQVVKAIAFFDTREFDEFWTRVSPAR